jgi:regulator of protease activity HflC (stomatin/prohibitin superfamily)
MTVATIILVLVILFVIWMIRRTIVIVHQAEVVVVERFGRFHKVLSSGLNTVVPFIDAIRTRVDLREQFITIPPQPVITKDNVTISVDNVLYYQVLDPQRAVYGVNNFAGAIENLVQTTLRSIIGDMTLDETLSNRDSINARLQEKLDRETNAWGVKVHRIEIKQIDPPKEIKEAMEKQMRAERDKRAQITQAEAQKQSQILEAEGYQTATVTRAEAERQKAILEARGQAEAIVLMRQAEARGLAMLKEAGADSAVLTLKALEALTQAAQGPATTIIVPSDLAGVAGALAGLTRVVTATSANSDLTA